MIHIGPEIIKPGTLRLLVKLQADERLSAHFLVGGTALPLLFGHRHSIDLDLFSREEFDESEVELYLQDTYDFNTTVKFKNTLMGFIDGVKVDLITHKAPLVKAFHEEEHIRMASALDVSAMKLNAITQSGKRQKDFYDLFFLLEKYRLAEMLTAYEFKYPKSSPMIPLRALTYFDDIEFDVEPPQLLRRVTFKQVSKRLQLAVANADHTF